MNEKPRFKQIGITNIVNNIKIALIISTIEAIIALVPTYYNVRLAPVFIAMFIPLHLICFVVSMIANPITIRLVGMNQAIETTNYNIGNG